MHGVLVFGDSITAGRGVAKNKSWVSRLAQGFDKKDKGGIIIYNLGVAGESTRELMTRFKIECKARSRRRSPDDYFSIVFAIGINDSKGIYSPNKFMTPLKTFQKNILKLIMLAKKYSDNITFVGLTPVDELKTAPLNHHYFLNRNIKIYNDAIKNICKEKRIPFAEIFKDWTVKNYKVLLSEDGIHPNETGHLRIFRKVASLLTASTAKSINPFQALVQEYSLSERDINALKSRFVENKFLNNDLFFGQFYKEKPTIVFGGPCIRKDIEGVSFNTFYQIFMPMKVASILRLPCVIVLATREEAILAPKLSKRYQELGLKLEKGIRQMARDLDLKVKIFNTMSPTNDRLIQKCIDELNLELPERNSRYLFELSQRKIKKNMHSVKRILCNKRVLACHSLCFMRKVSGPNRFLIVEDLEQHNCVLYVRKFEQNRMANFLAFLPLPNINGTACMFKSKKKERLLLSQKRSYYESVWKKFPRWVLGIFENIFSLARGQGDTQIKNFDWIFSTVREVSRYFE